MKNDIEVFVINGKEYKVITKIKENANKEEIYKIITRYALEKINKYNRE